VLAVPCCVGRQEVGWRLGSGRRNRWEFHTRESELTGTFRHQSAWPLVNARRFQGDAGTKNQREARLIAAPTQVGVPGASMFPNFGPVERGDSASHEVLLDRMFGPEEDQ